MKRFFAFTAIVAVITILASSCGSSQGGHCDAYGSVEQTEQNSDLASK